MAKLIKWRGYTTDRNISYNAESETYEGLYNAINTKYGYDTIFSDDAYERKLLEVNNQDVNSYEDDCGSVDFNLFDDFISNNSYNELSEQDYKQLIEESTSQAYYHEFEVVSY